MSWQIIKSEPTYGICDQCKKHDCGILPDGTQQWVITGMKDRLDDPYVIGYKCIEIISANMGITKQVAEKVVEKEPSDDQVLRLIKSALARKVNGS